MSVQTTLTLLALAWAMHEVGRLLRPARRHEFEEVDTTQMSASWVWSRWSQ